MHGDGEFEHVPVSIPSVQSYPVLQSNPVLVHVELKEQGPPTNTAYEIVVVVDEVEVEDPVVVVEDDVEEHRNEPEQS